MLLAAAVPMTTFTSSAEAAPLIVSVTSTADDGSPGTLRWAIDQANLEPPTTNVTIQLAAGTYPLTTCGAAADDANTAGDLDARPAAALALTGLGGGATIQQTCAGERVLDVLPPATSPGSAAAMITLTNVTISGGDAVGDGGGVRSAGDVSLQDAVLDGNHAAVPSPFFDPVAGIDVHGGGLSATGTVTISGGRVQDNTVNGGDAGISGSSVELPAGVGLGGGVYAPTVALDGVTVQSNVVTGGLGMPYLAIGGYGKGGAGRGGGVAGDHVTITSSTFTHNRAAGGDTGAAGEGGAAWGTLVDVATSTLQSNEAVGATGQQGQCGVDGGAAAGGALAGVTVHVAESTLESNAARGGIGGSNQLVECNPGVGGGALGGAIDADVATITGSTLQANASTGGAGGSLGGCPCVGGDGGGPASGGAVFAATSVTLTSSTLSTDQVTGGQNASGGVAAASGSEIFGADTVALTYVTALDVDGGSSAEPSITAGTLTSRGALLTSQTGSFTCGGPTPGSPPATTSDGGNVARDPGVTCGFDGATDLSADDPATADLSPLGDHGGPTPTMLPLSTNPGVDRDPPPCALDVDQRGAPRPQGAGCDAGAVEIPAPPPSIAGTVTETGSANPLVGITVTLMNASPAWTVAATTTTDGLGHYRFDGVADGAYELRFFDATGVHERRWWSSAPTYRSGSLITVLGGSSPPADQALALAPTGSIHGRAQTASSDGLPGIDVLLFDTTSGYVRATVTGPQGYYQFDGVPAGTYEVQFRDPTHTYLSRWSGGAVLFPNATPVIVTSSVTWSSVILR